MRREGAGMEIYVKRRGEEIERERGGGGQRGGEESRARLLVMLREAPSIQLRGDQDAY